MAEVVVWRDLDPSLALDVNGDIKVRLNAEAVEGAIENILRTVTGERVMLRSFPGLLHNLLFEPLKFDSLKRNAEQELIRAIELWDSRVKISFLDIAINQDQDRLDLNIEFYIRGYDKVFILNKVIK